MKISEVEVLTGITKKNIRFYEKEGLLTPNRNDENKYRDYSLEEVSILKEIKLLRKLDISISDILLIQKGVLSLNACMIKYSSHMENKIKEMYKAKEICDEINKKDLSLATLNTDSYLEKIDTLEESGLKFVNIAQDFITKAKGCIPVDSKIWFEPDNPITNKREFTDEIIKYCTKNKMDFTITHEGMEPLVIINGEKYLCMLETPRTLAFPFSIFFAPRTYGFRFVYMYKY